jgi:zinc D-Ala-D-Ala carboxypeptidase
MLSRLFRFINAQLSRLRPSVRAGLLVIVLTLAYLLFSRLFDQPPRSRPRIQRPPPPPEFVCGLNSAIGPGEIADCIDCMFYPVDKLHALPSTYAPFVVDTGQPGGGQVLPEVQTALNDLFMAARQEGLSPVVTSAYRSYADQSQAFNYWVTQELRNTPDLALAVENASRYSAPPGSSEHQLGTTLDINCDLCSPFDDQDNRNIYLWDFLEWNAHRFGFVISYPRGVESLTGYRYEPWHIRYIGVDYATQLYDLGYLDNNGVCLRAFLRIKATTPLSPFFADNDLTPPSPRLLTPQPATLPATREGTAAK